MMIAPSHSRTHPVGQGLWTLGVLGALAITACAPAAQATPRTAPSPTATAGASPSGTGRSAPSTATAPATPTGSNAPITAAGLSNLNAPSAVGSFVVGFDPASRRLILQVEALPSQGTAQPTLTVATWAWSGKTWTRLSPGTEPAPESQGSMAVDPVSGELMYMGGSAYTATSDSQNPWIPEWDPNQGTWLWNGSTWARVADNPEQGGEPALAADQATGQLLASCPNIQGIETPSGDPGDASPPPTAPAWYSAGGFYTWTGSGWVATPSAAADGNVESPETDVTLGAAIAYDPISKRLIQFGGNSQGNFSATLGYDGTAWTTLISNDAFLTAGTAAEPQGGPASAATDESSGQIVMLAQNSSYQAYFPASGAPTTWTWNGSTWIQLEVDEPPAAASPATGSGGQLVWDPALNAVILVYADSSGTIQLWTWGGTSTGWAQVSS